MSTNTPLPPEALDEWLAALAARLGLDADLVPTGLLLDVARDVAHNVARPAAPLSLFLVGLAAARNGKQHRGHHRGERRRHRTRPELARRAAVAGSRAELPPRGRAAPAHPGNSSEPGQLGVSAARGPTVRAASRWSAGWRHPLRPRGCAARWAL